MLHILSIKLRSMQHTQSKISTHTHTHNKISIAHIQQDQGSTHIVRSAQHVHTRIHIHTETQTKSQ